MATTTLHGGHSGADLDAAPIPGTTHIVDLEGTVTNAAHDAKKKEIILVPMPSDDPEDPLNWSHGRKTLQMFCIFM